MAMKFVFEDEDREIVHCHSDDSTWDEVLQRFEEFLKGVGYQPPVEGAHLEWVNLDADFVLRDKS